MHFFNHLRWSILSRWHTSLLRLHRNWVERDVMITLLLKELVFDCLGLLAKWCSSAISVLFRHIVILAHYVIAIGSPSSGYAASPILVMLCRLDMIRVTWSNGPWTVLLIKSRKCGLFPDLLLLLLYLASHSLCEFLDLRMKPRGAYSFVISRCWLLVIFLSIERRRDVSAL